MPLSLQGDHGLSKLTCHGANYATLTRASENWILIHSSPRKRVPFHRASLPLELSPEPLDEAFQLLVVRGKRCEPLGVAEGALEVPRLPAHLDKRREELAIVRALFQRAGQELQRLVAVARGIERDGVD